MAGGIHAWVQPDGGWCLNNAGIIVSQGESLLVDTAATRARALRLRDASLSLAPAPPRTVVATHFHGDHTFGNFVFPEATVIGHERTRTQMTAARLHMTGLWPDVEWGDIEILPPAVTYQDRLVVHVGDLRVELRHIGPAHTDNDTVVWVPEHGVLFTGDLAMAGVTPFVPMGSVAGSLAALDRLRDFGAQTVVPGHGRVTGPEVLDEMGGYLRWIQHLAREGVAAGWTPLEAAQRADIGPYRGLLDSERLVPNLHRAFLEERDDGSDAALGVHEMEAAFAEMVRFLGHPPTCHA